MFDLEQAIVEWRLQMFSAGIKNPEVLNELESHLRDDLEQQTLSGSNARQVFEAAVRQLGQARQLECEFHKVKGKNRAEQRLKQIVFTLAGIPNPCLATLMKTPNTNIEPGWATYLKTTAFLLPALFLWTLTAVFVVPKLQQICLDAGFGSSPAWNLTHSNIRTTLFFREHGLLIAAVTVLSLILLEWRSSRWPRYRRAAMGVGAFLLNSFALVSIFIMIITAILAAPALLELGRRSAAPPALGGK